VGRHIPVTSIGDKAIFLNMRTLVASAKVLPTVVGGTIIYLSSGTWSPAMDQCSLRAGTEQGPCSFVHAILGTGTS
jgi:hypothetical protein